MNSSNIIVKYELRDWINPRRLIPMTLSRNPYAIDFLKKNPHLIDWNSLCLNSAAISFLKENRERINWTYLKFNKNGKELYDVNKNSYNTTYEYYYENIYNDNYFRKIMKGEINPEDIDFSFISTNPNAIDFLKDNYNNIDWYGFSENPAIFIQKYED
jgi:hypothetical protein